MSRRFFRHGELPLVLLALVDEQPRNGYEIMAELTHLFGPRYRASPGSIYPAVEALAVEGLIEGSERGGRTIFQITESGRQALSERGELLAALELRVGVDVGRGGSLETMLARFKARLSPLTGRIDADAAAEILDRAADEIEQLKPTRSNRKRSQK